LPEVQRLIAECVLRQGEGRVDEAIAHYRAAVEAETSPVLKLDSMAKLIRLVGVERNLVPEAEALFADVEATAQDAALEGELLAAYRRTLIASGDAYLWNERANDALTLYREAEALAANPIPVQVRAARTGAYPEAIAQYLAEANYGAALDVLDQWEQTFPTEKFTGHPLFWRGKALALRGQPQQALGLLTVSVRLGVGAEFETEARWLLAESLEAVGKPEEASRELAKLVAIGMKDSFSQQAKEKLQGAPGEGSAHE
jgi:tetratricopeptide (TPR) repeat protein